MKILVVDDHVLIRDAVRGVLKELTASAVVMDAGDGRQAMGLIESHTDLDLVLLDLGLPDRDGLNMLADLRQRRPEIAVVVLSAAKDRASVTRALELGAMGFIPKNAQREVMLRALQLVMSGNIYIPPEALARDNVLPGSRAKPRAGDPPRPPAVDIGLTDRQLDVLALMMKGKSNKMICRMLNLAEQTVKNHVTAVLKALNAANRTEAVITAAEMGLGALKQPE